MPTVRSRVAVIFVTVLIDLIGFGIVLPILPYYAKTFGAGGLGLGALFGVYSLMQFFGTSVLGKLSDRVGRRPVLLTTMLINALGYLLFAYAGTYPVLFLARMVSGFAGGNISAAQAYMADISPAAERSRAMSIIGAAFGIGFVVGPAIGGIAGSHVLAGLIAAGLSVANFASAYLLLAESLREEHRSTRAGLGLGNIVRGLGDARLRPLLLIWLILPFAFAGYQVAMSLYPAQAYGWHARQLGYFFTVVGLTIAVVQGYLFRLLVRRTGDRILVIVGTFGMALGVAIAPFTGSEPLLYASGVLLAFSNSLVGPAATGLVSVYAAPTEQGAVLGAAQALGALGRFGGPETLGKVFDDLGARAAFLAAGAVMLLAWVASLALARDATQPPAAVVQEPRPAQ
ncbi:MAG TPA: MFS transporter [Gemmatimonadales bacterium]|nr:MFS transporter [Gemmatimonadales bacterium]